MMKKLIIFSLVALSCTFIYGKENSKANKKTNRHKLESKEEIKTTSFVDSLMRFDKNKDGLLSKAELETIVPPNMRPMGPRPSPNPWFKMGPTMGPKPSPWGMKPPMNFPSHWQRNK